MLEIGGGPEQGGHLLPAQDLGQLAAGPLIRDLRDRPVLLEHLALEEAQGADDLVEVRLGRSSPSRTLVSPRPPCRKLPIRVSICSQDE